MWRGGAYVSVGVRQGRVPARKPLVGDTVLYVDSSGTVAPAIVLAYEDDVEHYALRLAVIGEAGRQVALRLVVAGYSRLSGARDVWYERDVITLPPSEGA